MDLKQGVDLRHPNSGELGEAPQLLEDIAAMLANRRTHPDTVVQLDMKDDDPAPTPALERFAAALDGCSRWFVASGMSWPAVAALGGALPGLRLGFDPLTLALETRPDSAQAFHRFVRQVVSLAPRAEIIYLHHELLADAAAVGMPIVDAFRDDGRSVDCWTLDSDHESIGTLLPLVVEMGVDQITTNGPIALEALWRS